jgi:predicted transcriptional regulator
MSMPASNPCFADRLITLLTEADLPPADLAARADVPLQALDACLKGELPDAISLYRIAKALDVTPAWLRGGGGGQGWEESIPLTRT